MYKLSITNFFPSKKESNILGFIGLRFEDLSMTVKCKVIRNTKTGHVFISMPSEQYTSTDGNTRFSDYIRFDKEKYDDFQSSAIKAWNEFSQKQPLPSKACKNEQFLNNLIQNPTELPF